MKVFAYVCVNAIGLVIAGISSIYVARALVSGDVGTGNVRAQAPAPGNPVSAPRIVASLSPDSRTLTFACATGPACPLQFGAAVIFDATPPGPLTATVAPSSGEGYLMVATGPNGVRVGSLMGAVTVACGVPAWCQQDADTYLHPGELPLAAVNVSLDGTFRNLRDAWVGAVAAPVVNVVTDETVTCSMANTTAAVTVTCGTLKGKP